MAGACLVLGPSFGWFWRWHCRRCPFLVIGRKLSGQGMWRILEWSLRYRAWYVSFNRLPSLQGNDTYLALNLCRAPRAYYGQKHSKTFFTPFGFFLVSRNPLRRFWGKMLRHLSDWSGKASWA